MSLSRNVELRQERARIASQMHELAKVGTLTTEQNEQFERMDADQLRLKTEIDRLERADALETETRARLPQSDPSGNRISADEGEAREKKYASAYWKYMKRIRSNQSMAEVLTAEECQILTEYRATIGVEGTPAGGAYPGSTAGFVVPVGFIAEVISALKYYGPMLDGGMGMPRILVTETCGQLPFPTSDDTTAVGEIITENSAQNVLDVNTSIINFQSYKFSSKIVKVSWEMLQDAGINIPEFLSQRFSERLGRILNTKFTVGAGATEPNGIITASVTGGTAIGAGGNDGSSAANTVGSDDLVTLEHSIDPLYRRGARFMMHDSVLAAIKKVKDKYGRPLWLPGLAANTPDTINGYGYAINNDMDQLQAAASSPTVSKKTVLFGDLSKYLVRRVRDITVMRFDELYAANGQVGFVAFARYDGNLLDAGTHPVKFLTNTY